MVSLPSPPVTESLPVPSFIESSPPSPLTTSLPPNELMTSANAPPIKTSSDATDNGEVPIFVSFPSISRNALVSAEKSTLIP